MVIGEGCRIMESALIEDAVIWSNVQVGRQAVLKHSVAADRCHLAEDCLVVDSVLGDNVTVVGDCKLATGSKIWPGETVEKDT